MKGSYPLLRTKPQWLRIPIACSLALGVSLLITSCTRQSSPDDMKKVHSSVAVPVVVAQATASNVPVTLRNIGNVEPFSTVTVRSQITGQILKVHFQEGQEVKAGDQLFTIDSRPYEGALRHAQADLKRDEAQVIGARLEFDRVKSLLESHIASRDDYDKAEATLHALEATILADHSAISNATLNVEYTDIRSRIDGRTGNLMFKEGNVVKAPDDALVTINQFHPIYVTFSVPEQDLPAIRKRMQAATLPVEVEVPGDTSTRPHGELSFIDNTVDAATGRIKLKATFPNADNALWPGQFVQTALTVNTLANATVVPLQAIQSSQNGDFVFLVQADDTVKKRPVVTGLSQGSTIVVESGVNAGESIVVDGQLRLVDGAKVSIQKPAATSPRVETIAESK
jgi:multidrug efflux system membrane fusion protein